MESLTYLCKKLMTTIKPTTPRKSKKPSLAHKSASGVANPRVNAKNYRNLPWAEIELKFIRGYPRFNPTTGKNEIYKPTIEDISLEYKLPKDVVHRASKKEQPTWVEKRAAYQARLQEQGGAEHIWRITQAAMVDAETLRISYLGFTTIKNWFDSKLTLDEEGNLPKLSGKEIGDIASAAKNFQDLARRALSEPIGGDPELRAVARSKVSQVKAPSDLEQLTSKAKRLIASARERSKAKAKAIQTIAGDKSVETLEAEVYEEPEPYDVFSDDEIDELSNYGEGDDD